MKKIFVLLGVVLAGSILPAKTYIDKTNLDQLSYRALEAGQAAWNEEDGGAVMYIGSPSEVKTLRVMDPAALKGFRYKVITSELTLNASDNLTELSGGGGYRFTVPSDKSGMVYRYDSLSKHVVSNATDTAANIYGYATLGADGTFTDIATPANGTVINTSEDGIYGKRGIYRSTISVISKDSAIQELDFLFTQFTAVFGDMRSIDVRRTITYDDRMATLTFEVTGDGGTWFQAEDFTAKCLGIGDIIQANDLSVNKVYIKDRLTSESSGKGGKGRPGLYDEEDPLAGAFDLYELRYWAKHLYDGNRGEHWSKYACSNNVNMVNHMLYWNGRHAMGPSDNTFLFTHGNNIWMRYIPAGTNVLEGTEYEGVEIYITAIEKIDDCWTLDVAINVPDGKTVPTVDQLQVMYATSLNKPHIWYPISCAWEPQDELGLNYHVVIPQVYSEPKMGFWKIVANVLPHANVLEIKAKVRLMGSDGKMYDLSWPTGGGNVTATLVE